MGSEGETSDFNLPVYVAVGRDLKEGKSLLTWAVENFEGRNICLLHIQQPASLVALMNGKLSASKLKNHAIKACQEFERLKIQKLINQYLLFLSQNGKKADKVCIEMKSVEKGILQLINQHGIRWLVMGASAETFNSKKSETNSSKAMIVYQEAPLSCRIWFVSKGSLIYARSPGPDSHFSTSKTLSPSTNTCGTSLTPDYMENTGGNDENVQDLEHPTRSIEEVVNKISPTAPTVDQSSDDGSPLVLKLENSEHLPCSSSNTSLDSEFQEKETSDIRNKLEHAMIEHLPCSSSNTSLDSEFQEKETSDIRNKLEHAMIDAEEAKQQAFEESLRRWRAEEDALVAVNKAETAVSRYEEEVKRGEEMEEKLLAQKQEMETMKNQHDQFLKELKLIKEQKPTLERQLKEAHQSETELEDKIIQAVNLLITFKETRDKLQIEYDSAIRKVNKYRTIKTEDPSGALSAHFFGISFSDIIEATQNFQPSQKIGEGRYGSVFKGILGHVKVAIKMLPSSGSQSDSEFKNETEVLLRVRHPNLATLIGACPESRSLIYEYIENGSLENYLSNPAKASSLSWQIRIRIAIETCSALLFLHGNYSCNIHGNLKPSNILLDPNLVIKISDFGIFNLITQNASENDPENLAYMDPEIFENGELTTESDVYSFGVVLLRLLTSRPASSVVRDVKCAIGRGSFDTLLDVSAGDWPVEQAKRLANLGLRCCEKDRLDRADLESDVWGVLEPMRELCSSPLMISTSSCMDSTSQRKIPSHFVCPIYQEIMKDPHIAGDGFTYEGDAIRGWFDSGHSSSPMTNLKLNNCDLIPNYALYYAIQEWQQNA